MVLSGLIRGCSTAMLLMMLGSPASHAASAGLAMALEAAWERSPQARALIARRAEIAAARDTARAWTPGPPSLGLGERNDQLTGGDGIRETEVSLSAPVWLPGQKAISQSLAASSGEELEARLAGMRLEIAAQVRERLWEAAAAREAFDEARDHQQHLQALTDEVQRRVSAGDLARTDGMLAQQEVLAAQAAVSAIQARVNEAVSRYRLLTGHTDIPAAEIEADGMPAADPHPRVLAARAALQRAQASLRVLQASRREPPVVGLSMRRERDRDVAGSTHTVGIAIQVPFGTAARNRVQETAAATEIEEAMAELAQAENTAQADVQLAQQQLAEARRALDAAASRTALTAEHVQLIEKAFRLGERGLADTIRARALAHEAEAAERQQRVALGLAHARLNQAKGVLP